MEPAIIQHTDDELAPTPLPDSREDNGRMLSVPEFVLVDTRKTSRVIVVGAQNLDSDDDSQLQGPDNNGDDDDDDSALNNNSTNLTSVARRNLEEEEEEEEVVDDEERSADVVGPDRNRNVTDPAVVGRRKMLSKLQSLLRKKIAKEPVNGMVSTDPKKQRALLVQLEGLLFATAQTWQDYMDESSLDIRLRKLSLAIGRRQHLNWCREFQRQEELDCFPPFCFVGKDKDNNNNKHAAAHKKSS